MNVELIKKYISDKLRMVSDDEHSEDAELITMVLEDLLNYIENGK